MFGLKKKSHISVELNDYVFRGLKKQGQSDNVWDVVEIALPQGVISDSAIAEEMALYELLKENLNKLGGKKQSVRLFVPDTSVLLKTFEHPADKKPEELLPYVQMELGRTIHLPFQDPLIDVYDHTPDDGQAVLFAVPPEEVGKFVGILQDLHLEPIAADIRALSNLRVLDSMNFISEDKTYLVADWSINELGICIYTSGNVEFLRFQTIDTDLTKWISTTSEDEVDFTYKGELQEYMMSITDQVLELDRVLNFFRFSLYKGEKTVDELIMMGDNPYLKQISNLVSDNIDIPVQVISDELINKHYPQFKAKHASLIGLALKEV